MDQVHDYMSALETKTGKGFGDPAKPLLISVRSGSALSMPGMMDTILNLGLNDETAKGMIELTKNERFVNDAYRRFLQRQGEARYRGALQSAVRIPGIEARGRGGG
jgi:pyruvate,orthophosphate dikinase